MKIMLIGFVIASLFSGCLYRNSCGYGNAVWEDKTYYYDAQGNYREKCPDNVIYTDEALQQSQESFEAPIY